MLRRQACDPPGEHGQARQRKQSEYGMQLREKQKARRAYGVLEGQFHRYFEAAERSGGITGETLLVTLERRLDNVTYRLGFGSSRAHARQLVRHGHIYVNGKKVSIPSYLVDVNDVITVRERSAESEHFKALREGTGRVVPKWLTLDAANLKGTVTAMPQREDIDLTIQEHMIVELYSR
jgi:small subunit ribosomal protein S4